MQITASILVAFVALVHVYILVLEMFLWTRPKGLKVFGLTLEQAKASAVLAANQGLYNGFLAAGLVWSLVVSDASMAQQLKFFFLGCIAVAGVYGGATSNKRILFVQTVPAVTAMVFVALAGH
jgi:putative membrane protein